MAQAFAPWTNRAPRFVLAGVVALVVGTTFALWYWGSPWHTDVGYAPNQPVPFSHRLHAGQLGMDCRYCHHFVARSPSAGVPPTQTCMGCHAQVLPASPRLAVVRESWAEGKDGGPIPWRRVHQAPDFVYFNHAVHVRFLGGTTGVGCVACHGRVDRMVVVQQVAPLSMAWCLDCHRDPAPSLRPADEVTNMEWEPSPEWAEIARERGRRVFPPTVGCTGCHR